MKRKTTKTKPDGLRADLTAAERRKALKVGRIGFKSAGAARKRGEAA